jgi:hypothetical protein
MFTVDRDEVVQRVGLLGARGVRPGQEARDGEEWGREPRGNPHGRQDRLRGPRRATSGRAVTIMSLSRLASQAAACTRPPYPEPLHSVCIAGSSANIMGPAPEAVAATLAVP